MVRRGRYQTYTRSCVAGLGDPRENFCAGKFTTLTGFGTLSHLYLNFGGLRQVVAGDTEATGGNLLYSTVL